jgi:hypothetical protein
MAYKPLWDWMDKQEGKVVGTSWSNLQKSRKEAGLKPLPEKINKYGALNDIYSELQLKGYSSSEADRFVVKCGILSPNKQQLKPGISMKKIEQCLREARKERRMY